MQNQKEKLLPFQCVGETQKRIDKVFKGLREDRKFACSIRTTERVFRDSLYSNKKRSEETRGIVFVSHASFQRFIKAGALVIGFDGWSGVPAGCVASEIMYDLNYHGLDAELSGGSPPTTITVYAYRR